MSLFPYLRILFLAGLTLASVCLFAQEDREDVLYLHNGSVMRGEIVEQVIGEYVKIELLGGSVLVFPEDEVEKISRDARKTQLPAASATVFSVEPPPFTGRPKGLYHLCSFALVFGQALDWTNNENLWLNASFHYRIGHSFSQYHNVGIGTGIDFYQGGVIMPIYADYHGEIGPLRRVMPHYFVNLGYGAPLGANWDTREFRGGYMVHFGGGYKFNTRSRSEWLFTVGYRAQNTYQEREIWIGGGNEPVIATGTRLYQKIVMQVTLGF